MVGLCTQSYESRARALLVGVGADEQLGGYGRHRACWNTGGQEALDAEVAKDTERMWKRCALCWTCTGLVLCVGLALRCGTRYRVSGVAPLVYSPQKGGCGAGRGVKGPEKHMQTPV